MRRAIRRIIKFVPLDLILPVSEAIPLTGISRTAQYACPPLEGTRMYGGVRGVLSDERPYPDMC